jgi:putative colanic acid biosynthesis acetyltransferase WcaF
MQFANSPHSFANKLGRAAWGITYVLLFRPTPAFMFAWRRMILRVFGAKVDPSALCYPSVRIWAPWNLTIGAGSCLSHGVKCLSQGPTIIHDMVVVSQRAFLCTASHDHSSLALPLKIAPIVLERFAWICAEAFVGPGVTIGEGTIVAARAVVTRTTEPYKIVAGNPAAVIKSRVIAHEDVS